MSEYIAGVDPEVHCSACGKTFLCDQMDAACRLCGAMGTIKATKPATDAAGEQPTCGMCEQKQEQIARLGVPGFWHVSFSRLKNWSACRLSPEAMKWRAEYAQ